MQAAWRAFARARAYTGKRMLARIAMIAITTNSSMRVKPRRFITVAPFGRDHRRSNVEYPRMGYPQPAQGGSVLPLLLIFLVPTLRTLH